MTYFFVNTAFLFYVLSAVVGCSSETAEPEGVIPAAQLNALEEAKKVEDVLKSHDEAIRKKIEESN